MKLFWVWFAAFAITFGAILIVVGAQVPTPAAPVHTRVLWVEQLTEPVAVEGLPGVVGQKPFSRAALVQVEGDCYLMLGDSQPVLTTCPVP